MRALPALALLAATGCELPSPAEVPTNPYDDAEARVCPAFATGEVILAAGGLERSLQVQLPANPQGAPVVFAWHWLGGDASQVLDWMGLRALADAGYIVVAPESSGLAFEWDFNDLSAANPDLALFDAALACLWDEHQIDAERVFATGMSAGGLMTTFLTLHRADRLAATAPFSGGAFDRDYHTPVADLPVLLTWGGPSDTYGGFNFAQASEALRDNLEADGHLVVPCVHDLGHWPPAEAASMTARFFDAHRRGVASPWEASLPAGLPPWCEAR